LAGASGVTLILGATVVSGVAAYVVTWLVPHEIGLAHYALFAVFWSFLYLVVGTLSGLQQEVARSTRPAVVFAQRPVARATVFGGAAAFTVFAIILATAPAWVDGIFPSERWALVWPLAVGTASYALVAVFCGTLYGVERWLPLAVMVSVDAVLRLVFIGVALLVTTDIPTLAWAAAIPFPLTLIIVGLLLARTLRGRSGLDAGYRVLTWNVSRTIVAAASTSAMVSGFPLLLGLTSHGEKASLVGLYILSITLTRAPLIVVAMSLQSYFVVTFRTRSATFWRNFLRLQGLVLGAGAILALAGWVVGPAVFAFLFRGSHPDGWFIAVLVASSALVGSLCISAPAVLARGQHFIYAAGWFVAAVLTVLSLLLPFDLTTRTVLALLIGPVAGVLIHGAYLVVASRAERANPVVG
jgi:hypothetical protein